MISRSVPLPQAASLPRHLPPGHAACRVGVLPQMILAFVDYASKKKKKKDEGKTRGSVRGSISIGGDALKKGGARPVRRGLSKEKKGVIAALASGDEKQLKISEIPPIPKSDDELKRIDTALKDNYIFKPLTPEQRSAAYARLQKKTVEPGEVIFTAGDKADGCYIIDAGEMTSKIPSAQEGGKDDVAVLRGSLKVPYPLFGELALMYAKLRTQTVTCTKAGTLWVMPRNVFQAVLKIGMQDNSRALETLKSIDIFSSLSPTQLKKLSEGLTEQQFQPGDYIVRQGDNSASLYLIMEGHVECTRNTPSGGEEMLLELGPGQTFGERSILRKEPRAANVVATRKTVCLNVTKETFESQLGSLEAIIDKDRQQREYISTKRIERQQKKGLSNAQLNDFTLLANITDTNLGQYVYARHDPSKTEYTLKAFAKQVVLDTNSSKRVMTELKYATKLVDENSFVSSMITTMESDAYLLMVLETKASMDLHATMGFYGPFDEGTALFYAATIFLGLEVLHKMGIAYRNVNPEVIMLNQEGYPVLMDLMFASECSNEHKLTDLCGAFPYLSPEQVSGTGHTTAVDFWALGVLIYEMITEKTPWATGNTALDTEEAFYSKIASHYAGAVQYPDAFSLELVAILDKLLEPSVKQRLCTPQAFRSNGWLEVVNWDTLQRGAVAAPHGPECQKHLAEQKAAGISKCLPVKSYTGSTNWYDGFVGKKLSTPPVQRPPPVAEVSPPTPAPPPQESDREGKKKKSGWGKKKDVTL